MARWRGGIVVGALALLWFVPAASAQQRVGIASAVNPAATGQAPGGAVRTLLVGTDVVFNERITTTADGQTQILFLDRSAFSVGPNSEVVIDEFVYDPSAGTGKLVASVSKGVFRFVGGALSKNENAVSIKTPSATIGIRGGMLGLSVAVGGATTVMKIFGDAITVTTTAGSQQIVRNDFYQTVNLQGQFGSPTPAPATKEIRQATADGLNPNAGASGGAAKPPTEGTVTASNFSQGNSKDVAGAEADTAARQPTPKAVILNIANISNSPAVKEIAINLALAELIDEQSFVGLIRFLRASGVDLSNALPINFSTGAPLSVTSISQLPLTASASFGGTAIGTTLINGVRSIETSSSVFMVWNFATAAGSFNLFNFHGEDFNGPIQSPSGRANLFGGRITSTTNNLVGGDVRGSFFTRASPADTVSGDFFIKGPGGSAAGIFRAQ